jgi:hypothetical protein
MATNAICPVPGQPAMYGLGIRVAFYVQWFGVAFVEYLDETELGDIRFVSLLISSAMALAVVIQLAMNQLQPADIYISLLLASGMYLLVVPLWLWRVLTCFNPVWNPLKWTKETPSPMFKGANFVLLLALACLQVWYWTGYLPNVNWGQCQQWGFFFSQVALANKGFIAFNAIFWILVIIVCVGILLVKAGWEVRIWRSRKRRRRSKYGWLSHRHQM